MTLYLRGARLVDASLHAPRRDRDAMPGEAAPTACALGEGASIAHTIDAGHWRVDDGDGGGVVPVDVIPDGAEVLDCTGCLVTRSFVIAHHHIYSALARGMPPPSRAPTSFVEILESIWWKLDKALDDDMIRASALVVGIDALESGVTFVIDHHASPNAAPGSLHLIAETLDEVGLGHLLCYELSDRDGPARFEQGLAETDAYLAARRGLVGLHASFTVGDASLRRAVDLAERHDVGLHVHVAEAASDQEHCLARHGTRVVHRLADAGVLREGTLLVHALHLDEAERTVVADSPAWVVENVESNLNNGVGAFDARGLGDRILIGTDGMHSDALRSARTAWLADSAMGPAQGLARLRRAHDYLTQTGVSGHGDNDLVVLDYPAPTNVHPDNWAGHVMYGLDRAHVRDVVRGGRLVVKDHRALLVDVDAASTFAREQAERLWQAL